MTRPRQVWPGTFTVTRRTTQRQFLLRPDPIVTGIFLYVLAYCANKYGLEVHASCVLSTHNHLSLTDARGGRLSPFMQLYFSMTARAMNCYLGRFENFWSSPDAPCAVFVNPRAEDVVSQLAYVICNPVLSGLVRASKRWPGVCHLAHQVGKLKLLVPRPEVFFDPSDDGLPEFVELTLTLPKCIDATDEELHEMLIRKCKQIEEDTRIEMKASNRKFVGVKRIRRVRRTASPKTREPRFQMIPRVACKSTEQRVFLLRLLKTFWADYAADLEKFRAGLRGTVFPAPTFKMVFVLGCAGETVRAPPVIA